MEDVMFKVANSLAQVDSVLNRHMDTEAKVGSWSLSNDKCSIKGYLLRC